MDLFAYWPRRFLARARVSHSEAVCAETKSVVAVIPARNEEAVVGRAIASLLDQDYPGPLHIILVDDHSMDATMAAAGSHESLSIVEAGPLPKRLDRQAVGGF